MIVSLLMHALSVEELLAPLIVLSVTRVLKIPYMLSLLVSSMFRNGIQQTYELILNKFWANMIIQRRLCLNYYITFTRHKCSLFETVFCSLRKCQNLKSMVTHWWNNIRSCWVWYTYVIRLEACTRTNKECNNNWCRFCTR